jgi:hypothetical protein
LILGLCIGGIILIIIVVLLIVKCTKKDEVGAKRRNSSVVNEDTQTEDVEDQFNTPLNVSESRSQTAASEI